MMKNGRLSKAVAGQKSYEFRVKLTNKCKQNDIELRIVDRWYLSSKLCSCCGNIKKDLKLSDRTYICEECGLVINRDLRLWSVKELMSRIYPKIHTLNKE